MVGEFVAANDALDTADRLSSRQPWAFGIFHARALASFGQERYKDAASWAGKAISQYPTWAFAHRTLATSLAYLEQLDAARAALTMAMELDPSYSPEGDRIALTAEPKFAARYLKGLRMAGL